MAQRSDLLIHHCGHGSYLTGLSAGTLAVVIPTYSERESNARRLAELGAGEYVLPKTDQDGEKVISMDEFREKVWRVLTEPDYKRNALKLAQSFQAYGGAIQIDQNDCYLGRRTDRARFRGRSVCRCRISHYFC